MHNIEWSDINIGDELERLETLLAASLLMNYGDETEQELAISLIDKALIRVREILSANINEVQK
jgi:hypothetical protein